MTEPSFLVCSACGHAACADGRVVCDQPHAPVQWADTPYPKDEESQP